ncbi:MAG: nucleotidyltransferase [Halioglobus sp.]|jgi:Cyclic GMP-AMP synthase DncV-like, nucleotidyltransferase domain
MLLLQLLKEIELPDEAYEISIRRYEDLGQWLGRGEARCARYNPHIGSQGSFLLGTATKPPVSSMPYDLDLFCSLTQGMSKNGTSQADLKLILGEDLKDYRIARQISAQVSEKKRCWRIDYADRMSFHLDVTPGIPAADSQRESIRMEMLDAYSDSVLARSVSEKALYITDNSSSDFKVLSPNWPLSNPEGYGIWFQSRMRQATEYLSKRSIILDAEIDKVPSYRWKSPLQNAILLIKRHRDIMFKDDPDIQPISIILTTLAAQAYRGENDVESALSTILEKMESYILPTAPRIPNPVNAKEDFADKWTDPQYQELRLEENFHIWIAEARRDFDVLLNSREEKRSIELAKRAFGVTLKSSAITTIASPYIEPKKISSGARPWLRG